MKIPTLTTMHVSCASCRVHGSCVLRVRDGDFRHGVAGRGQAVKERQCRPHLCELPTGAMGEAVCGFGKLHAFNIVARL